MWLVSDRLTRHRAKVTRESVMSLTSKSGLIFDQISLSLRSPWDLWIAIDPTVVLGDTDNLVKTHQEKNRLLILFNLTVATTLVVPSI